LESVSPSLKDNKAERLGYSKKDDSKGNKMLFDINKNFKEFTNYEHSPAHLFLNNTYYIITAHILKNIRPFYDDERKQILLNSIFLNFIDRNGWKMIAYFVADNHYHLLLNSANNADKLSKIIADIHRFTAITINKMDNLTGRQVWYQYWDTVITSNKSFYARFNYIHYNPVKHGYVTRSEDYKFCSYKDYFENDENEMLFLRKKYKFDKVKVKEP